MLPPPTLAALDRLVALLMTLVRAVAPVPPHRRDPYNAPPPSFRILFLRLSALVATLLRIADSGIPARPGAARRRPTHPAPRAAILSLPRRPGWLLDALPGLAPLVAADLGTLLADPAFAALVDAAPILRRTLAPLCRSLALAVPQPQPPSPAPPTRIALPRPAPSTSPVPHFHPLILPPKMRRIAAAHSHDHFVPLSNRPA